jgi:hypothetical protein
MNRKRENKAKSNMDNGSADSNVVAYKIAGCIVKCKAEQL